MSSTDDVRACSPQECKTPVSMLIVHIRKNAQSRRRGAVMF
jgi:hypothetical protein